MLPNPAPAAAAPGNPATPDPEHRTLKIKQALKALVVAGLAVRLGEVFGRADTALLDLARCSHSPKEQEALLGTTRRLRQAQGAITRQFAAAVEAAFEAAAGSAADAADRAQLSLLQPEQLARRIAILSMITRAQGRYQFQLWEIERRIGALAAYGRIPITSRAITPEGLCESIQRSVESLGLEAEVQLALYRLFDRLVLARLSDFYGAVLELLRRECPTATGCDAASVAGPAARLEAAAPGQDRNSADRPPLAWLL